MAMISKRTNPINIAPFVDILLILFVILIVAARFTQDSEISLTEIPVNKIEELEKQLLDKKTKLEELDNQNISLKSKLSEIEKTKESQAVKLRQDTKHSKKLEAISAENKKLKEENKKLQNRGVLTKIDQYGGVYLRVNEKLVKMPSEEIVNIVLATENRVIKTNMAESVEAQRTWQHILEEIGAKK